MATFFSYAVQDGSNYPTTVDTIAESVNRIEISHAKINRLTTGSVVRGPTADTYTVTGYTPTNFSTLTAPSGFFFYEEPGADVAEDPPVLKIPKGAVITEAYLVPTEDLQADTLTIVLKVYAQTSGLDAVGLIFQNFPLTVWQEHLPRRVAGPGSSAPGLSAIDYTLGGAGYRGLGIDESEDSFEVAGAIDGSGALYNGQLKLVVTYKVLNTE